MVHLAVQILNGLHGDADGVLRGDGAAIALASRPLEVLRHGTDVATAIAFTLVIGPFGDGHVADGVQRRAFRHIVDVMLGILVRCPCQTGDAAQERADARHALRAHLVFRLPSLELQAILRIERRSHACIALHRAAITLRDYGGSAERLRIAGLRAGESGAGGRNRTGSTGGGGGKTLAQIDDIGLQRQPLVAHALSGGIGRACLGQRDVHAGCGLHASGTAGTRVDAHGGIVAFHRRPRVGRGGLNIAARLRRRFRLPVFGGVIARLLDELVLDGLVNVLVALAVFPRPVGLIGGEAELLLLDAGGERVQIGLPLL